MTRSKFALLYGLALPLTYILPYFGSNSLLTALASFGFSLGGTIMHLACFGVMFYAARERGRAANLPWLQNLPLAALAFDMLPILTSIPLVPTVLHGIALYRGIDERWTAP